MMGQISVRAARNADIPLVLSLVNRAGGGLPLEMWKQSGPPDTNPWDVGAELMMYEHADIYLGNTWVAEDGKGGQGVVVLYSLPRPKRQDDKHEALFMKPLIQLEAEAADTTHVSYLCTVEGARSGGLGSSLLRFSESFRGRRGMSIVVAGENARARALYERFGYQELTHRPLLGPDGSMTGDRWILMVKSSWPSPLAVGGSPEGVETAMIDRSALEQLKQALGDDPADLIDLIDTFLGEAPEILAEMDRAAAAGDLVMIRRKAHSLKSNARDLGATALAGLCAWLEGDLRDGRDPGDLALRVNALRAEWSRVEATLKQEIVDIGAGS